MRKYVSFVLAMGCVFMLGSYTSGVVHECVEVTTRQWVMMSVLTVFFLASATIHQK
jgi:hypothetical protein